MTLVQDVQCFSFRVIGALQHVQCNCCSPIITVQYQLQGDLRWPCSSQIALAIWYACSVLIGRLTLFGNSWGMISPTKKIFLFNIFENIDIVPWVGKIRRSKGYLDIYRISSAVLFKKGFSPHQRSSLWNTSLYLIYAFVQNNNCSGVVNIPHDVCNVDPQNCIRHCGQFIDP